MSSRFLIVLIIETLSCLHQKVGALSSPSRDDWVRDDWVRDDWVRKSSMPIVPSPSGSRDIG